MKNLFNKLGERLNRVSSMKLTLLAVISALIVGAFIIIFSDIDNLGEGDILGAVSTVGSAYWALVVGSFGSLRAISNTINSSTPLSQPPRFCVSVSLALSGMMLYRSSPVSRFLPLV